MTDSLTKIITEMHNCPNEVFASEVEDWASRLEALQGEPVAWRYKLTHNVRFTPPLPQTVSEWTPLYAFPQEVKHD